MSATAVTLTLSYPPKALMPNARVHWAEKAAAVKRYKQEAWARAREVMTPLGWHTLQPPVVAEVEFVVTVKRGRDGDNLGASLKAAWDGMVDARLLAGDTVELLTIRPPTVALGPRAEVRVVLEGAL
jgi:hypothetical protein